MAPPNNAVYFVQAEVSLLMTAMKWGARMTPRNVQDEENDPLFRSLSQLRDMLNNVSDIQEIDSLSLLVPFLEVIRSEDTTGPITGLALTAVDKLLGYGILSPTLPGATSTVEAVADAVTHARFVGTDPNSDEVVLMKILHVLRTLLLVPVGLLLTNESVCEIMQSCFRICFETRLSELLRKTAEYALMNMVQLLFSRLPHLKEDPLYQTTSKKLKMRKGGMESSRLRRKKPTPVASVVKASSKSKSKTPPGPQQSSNKSEETPDDQPEQEVTPQQDTQSDPVQVSSPPPDCPNTIQLCSSADTPSPSLPQDGSTEEHGMESSTTSTTEECRDERVTSLSGSITNSSEYTNPRGVRFTTDVGEPQSQSGDPSPCTDQKLPYGLPCVRELLRFLVSLLSPDTNPDTMVHMGLTLVTVALESGADHISQHKMLLAIVKDDLTKNLMMLLNSERLSLFAASLRVCFLLFEAMRSQLKFQLEMYLQRLMAIITSDSEKISIDQREIALESIVQFWRIPGLVTELFLNYDCDLFCSNLLEDITKLVSKNAFPVSRLHATHLLSLDALLAVIDSVELQCTATPNKTHTEKQITPPANPTSASSSEVEGKDEDTTSQSEEDVPLPPHHSATPSPLLLTNEKTEKDAISKKGVGIRPNRMPVSDKIPTREMILAARQKKKLLMNGTDKFNHKPKEGIAFLQSHGLLSQPLQPEEVALYLRENPRLDKRMIGDYISTKANARILEAFVTSFDFGGVRIDEALRRYLEAFRLPGEAPLIQHVLEYFAEVWHRANGSPFASVDATFTLAYAVVMLNTDQHNPNSKKQNIPMTVDDFKKNLKGINGGANFDASLLEEIYWTIRSDEIVMPSEQAGSVKENYLWKLLLRRGMSEQGRFLHVPTGSYDDDLFLLIWGPSVAALSFVFDKTADPAIFQKAIAGFRKCAVIAAHYQLSDVFDNLVISLCKFTTLLSQNENPIALPTSFGRNEKAQLACRSVFHLAFRHADILRDGWKSLMDCLLQLYRSRLLPECLLEADDFLHPDRKIRLYRETQTTSHKQETGMLSSFYLYFTSDSATSKGPSSEDHTFRQKALDCVTECHIEQLIEDSRFLQDASLIELTKALVLCTKGNPDLIASPEPHNPALHAPNKEPNRAAASLAAEDEEGRIFYVELLLRVLLHNRDRMVSLWPLLHVYMYAALVAAPQPPLLMERSVVGLLRLAIRLIRRQDLIDQIFSGLQLLPLMKPSHLTTVSRQVVCGLHDLIHTHAPSIPAPVHWSLLFALLEICGAGALPSAAYKTSIAAQMPPLAEELVALVMAGQSIVRPSSSLHKISESGYGESAQSDTETSCSGASSQVRGYTSDSELYDATQTANQKRSHHNHNSSVPGGEWIIVNKDSTEDLDAHPVPPEVSTPTPSSNPFTIVLQVDFRHRDSRAMIKACETLAFLVRDPAHITPDNFQACIHTLRVFVEAGLHGPSSTSKQRHKHPSNVRTRRATPGASAQDGDNDTAGRDGSKAGRGKAAKGMKRSKSNPSQMVQEVEEEAGSDPEMETSFHNVSIQLLDLLHTLHSRAHSIYTEWSRVQSPSAPPSPSILWEQCWCPLLQAMARICCDSRRAVRQQALTILQRSLLAPDLQTLTANEWEACFTKVLFPLMSSLLEPLNPGDPCGMEETRMRASTLLSKVFLQHLTPLFSLTTFVALWLTILDFMDKYMHANNSDLLIEAVPESLKNMLLVMETADILRSDLVLSLPPSHPPGPPQMMWRLTWDRIDSFLPGLRAELFPDPSPSPTPSHRPSSTKSEIRESPSVTIQIESEEDTPVNETSPSAENKEPVPSGES